MKTFHASHSVPIEYRPPGAGSPVTFGGVGGR